MRVSILEPLAPRLPPSSEQDRRIVDAIDDMRPRLRSFVRSRVGDDDVEDILQDVFSELVEAYRLVKPIEDVGAWLFRVARNRIIDRFRKKRPEQFPEVSDDRELLRWEDTLPSADAGPEALYARRILLEEISLALGELPPEQRDAFIAHEIDGLSFNEIAETTGVSVNTLLSRKRYAVLFLRKRLKAIYDEFRTD